MAFAKRPPDNPEMIKKLNNAQENGCDVIVHGYWSRSEHKLLVKTVSEYLESRGLCVDQFREYLASDRSDVRTFRGLYKYVRQFFPNRTLKSIIGRTDRMFHPHKNRPWNPEDEKLLYKLIKKYGHQWTIIGRILNRYRYLCHDKYEKDREARAIWLDRSKFTEKDDDQLIAAIKLFCGDWDDPKDIPTKIPWIQVGRILKRSASLCSSQWRTKVHAKVRGYKSDLSEWKRKDFALLIFAMHRVQAKHLDEIPWNALETPYTPIINSKAFKYIVRHMKLKDMKFRKQMEFLYEYYSKRFKSVNTANGRVVVRIDRQNTESNLPTKKQDTEPEQRSSNKRKREEMVSTEEKKEKRKKKRKKRDEHNPSELITKPEEGREKVTLKKEKTDTATITSSIPKKRKLKKLKEERQET